MFISFYLNYSFFTQLFSLKTSKPFFRKTPSSIILIGYICNISIIKDNAQPLIQTIIYKIQG